jgi:hypothetical protein
MATIGSFKKVGNDYQGEIVTLSLQAKGVRISPSRAAPLTRTHPVTASSSAGPIMRRAELREVPPFDGLVFADLGVLRSA